MRNIKTIPWAAVAAMLGMAGTPGVFNSAGQVMPRFRRQAKRYKVNSGTRAQQRHKRQMERGLISEDQILRGVK